jgi:3,4-dihydroxy 2-butanone 4-phosphate synthase/GTP cyclohydrolase II
MSRRPDLERFAQEHGLKIGTIADLIHYRLLNESTLDHLGIQPVQTDHGEFAMHIYRDRINGDVHLALVRGQVDPAAVTLVRVQLGLTVRDLLGIHIGGSSGWNAGRCMARIASEGAGVLVLLGGGEDAASLLDSVASLSGKRHSGSKPAGEGNTFLNIGVGSQILRMLGVRKLRHMSAPIRYHAISGFDLEIVEYVSPD